MICEVISRYDTGFHTEIAAADVVCWDELSRYDHDAYLKLQCRNVSPGRPPLRADADGGCEWRETGEGRLCALVEGVVWLLSASHVSKPGLKNE